MISRRALLQSMAAAPRGIRLWKAGAADDGSIHCLGNGRLIVYALGPHLIRIFGPPYSTPSIGDLRLIAPEDIEVRSTREPRAAVWRHVIRSGEREIAELIDFVAADRPCFLRRVTSTVPLTFRFQPARGIQVAGDGTLVRTPAGVPIYMDYPLPKPVFHRLAAKGASFAKSAEGVDVVFSAGEGTLLIAGGPSYPEAVTLAEEALRAEPAAMLERTRNDWLAFSRRRRGVPATLENISDDVAVLIRAQQAAEGAVLAGYPYHLGYVRDQYGVSRVLLALGHTSEAKRILDFYSGIFARHGVLHNAQGIGIEPLFHHHENDEVESTGYLIVQAFDLARRIGDPSVIAPYLPMLEWAWESQKKHLVRGMLPFNGDETYVAGGILPRTALNDGSAEATLLFIEGGRQFLDWLARLGRWPKSRIDGDREMLESTARAYRNNFWREGRLLTNNPERRLAAQLPRFRHGVCERCMAERRFRGLSWTERNPSGRYLCPDCLALGPYPADPAPAMSLPSVSLFPLYINSNLISRAELTPVVVQLTRRLLETGSLAARSVGYDFGLLLYALAELAHPSAKAVAERVLSLADVTGSWSEYYENSQHRGTRCRPWESAINLEALLRFAG